MKKELKNKTDGITLIALVVTIIVLLILAGISISIVTGNNGLFDHASTSKISTELSGYKEQLEMFKADKIVENIDFYEGSLTSGKNNLFYNTKENEEERNIKAVIPTISDEYLDIMEIIKGKLLINTQDRKLIKIAKSLDIEVNPYIIIDGELMSADTNLMLVDENGTLTVPENVTRIGEGSFSNVEGLKTIIIPGTVKTIGLNAFRNNATLERVIMLEGVESIEGSAFSRCSNLREVVIPDTVTDIGGSSFSGCSNLDNVNLPSNITTLNYGIFNGCSNLANITLPSSLKSISSNVFFSCVKLRQIDIPSSVNSISATAFANAINLSTINLQGNGYYQYQNGILSKKDGSEVCFVSDSVLKSSPTLEITEGVKNFTINISGYSNIKKIVIPASLTGLGGGLFLPNSIEEIVVENGNNTFTVGNNCLYINDSKELLLCYSKDINISINSNVEVISNYSFRPAVNVESVTLPDSIQQIGQQVFQNNDKLTMLRIGKGVRNLDPLFMYKDYQGSLIIDEDNPFYKVENNVIYKKDGKTLITVLYRIDGKFTIDSNVEEIGNYAFHNQFNMTEIELNNKIKSISSSFNYCTQLQRIEIPSSIESISKNAFDNSTNLKEVIIHKEENSIENSPFGNIYGLKAIKWQP